MPRAPRRPRRRRRPSLCPVVLSLFHALSLVEIFEPQHCDASLDSNLAYHDASDLFIFCRMSSTPGCDFSAPQLHEGSGTIGTFSHLQKLLLLQCVVFWPAMECTTRTYSFFAAVQHTMRFGSEAGVVLRARYRGYRTAGKSSGAFIFSFFWSHFLFPAFYPALTLDT